MFADTSLMMVQPDPVGKLPRALVCYDRMGTEPPAAPANCQPLEVVTFCMQLEIDSTAQTTKLVKHDAVSSSSGKSAFKSDDLTIEDSFARQRKEMVAATVSCVPAVSGVTEGFAILTNKSLVSVGSQVHWPGCQTGPLVWWTLAALAPAMAGGLTAAGYVLWETTTQSSVGAVWALSECCTGTGGPLIFAKPIGIPANITYPHDLPSWFTGTYWREEVLESSADILSDRLLSSQDISYDRVARVLPRLTGQMGETIEGQRHRGGPSFVSDPESARWWQVRQNGAVITGGTSPTGQSLHTIGEPFHPGWTRPDRACEWPNHDGPPPDHGPQCMHVSGLLNGYLPVLNQGIRDTSTGAAFEQMVLASGDSVFVANRTGNVSAGWQRWTFYRSELRDNSTERLVSALPFDFISALVQTTTGASEYLASTALSEGSIEISAEPLLADAARACVLLSRATYVGLRPKYGTGPQYWKAVNDAFPPTTLATALTLGSIGAPSAAADRLGYFLENLVDSSGHVQYYGTAMSELGQLLQAASTVVVGLDALGPDVGQRWLATNGAKLGAIAETLLIAQHNATQNRGSSHGLLWGCPEADLCATTDGQGSFFTSGLWAWRGLHDLAAAVSTRTSRPVLGNTSVAAMQHAAAQLLSDSRAAIAQSQHSSGWIPPCLDCPSAASPFMNMTESRIASYTNYRFYPEMFSSGGLPADVASRLGQFRRTHGGEILGMTRFETWLDDWPLQAIALYWLELEGNFSLGSADHYAMAMISHIAHHSARGTFTAYEQSNWADNQADNWCGSSRLFCTVPFILTPCVCESTCLTDCCCTQTVFLRSWLLQHCWCMRWSTPTRAAISSGFIVVYQITGSKAEQVLFGLRPCRCVLPMPRWFRPLRMLRPTPTAR